MKEVSSYKVIDKDSGSVILNGNESPMNYDLTRMAFIAKRIKEIELNRYPDTEATKLRELYAKYIGVKKENLIAGHGSDEMINLIISRYICKGKRLYTLYPDFSMYDFYTSINEGEIIKFKTLEDGSFEVANFISEGLDKCVDLIIISNPNNPTGYMISENDVISILENFKSIPVIIDEAYIEFCGNSSIKLINKYKNLIVTRTLSKAWGLASLRVGFLVSNIDLVKELNEYKVPYNVSEVAQVIACNILENENICEKIDKIMKWKEELYFDLKEIEKESSIAIKFYKGYANFIYGRCEFKESILQELDKRKIVIRNFNDNTFRITVGFPMQNKQVVDVLRKTCIYEEVF